MSTFCRDIRALADKQFDVLIIGGGINGVSVAWDAASRGLRVALVEKGDFGEGTSQGCFKIVHGGLRYLQHADFSRLYESVREQRTLGKIAPHLVHPLPFLVPCYGYGMRSRGVLSIGMMLYELLASRRNKNVDAYHQLPKHQLISKEHCLRLAPGLDPRGISGGVLYYDSQMSNCDRLTLSFAKSASRAGAILCNYVEASKFCLTPVSNSTSSISNVVCKCLFSGKIIEIKSRCIVNAAGPWSNLVAQMLPGLKVSLGCKSSVVFSKGVQVVVPQVMKQYALALESSEIDEKALISRGGRSYFMTPWRGHTLIGTLDCPYEGHPDNLEISKDEVVSLVREVQSMYKSDVIKEQNVTFAFGGLRPVDKHELDRLRSGLTDEESVPGVSRRDEVIDHQVEDKEGSSVKNLISVLGVKYTTTRALAEEVVDIVVKKIKIKCAPCTSAETPLVGGDIGDYEVFMSKSCNQTKLGLTSDAVKELIDNYGSEVERLYGLMDSDSSFGAVENASQRVIKAQVLYAIRNEMACKLSDVIMRRTPLGTLGSPSEEVLAVVGRLMADELGWDSVRSNEEIQEVRKRYYCC